MIATGKLVNRRFLSPAALLVFSDLSQKYFFIRNSTIQALPLQYARLDSCHIQPRPALGRIVKLQLPSYPPSLGRLGRFTKRCRLVFVKIIQSNSEHLCLRVSLIDGLFHSLVHAARVH
jgi:hypothetical protein